MNHKGDIIITSDMHIKLVGMVTNSKTTWPKIFQIKRENLQTRNRKKNEETNDDEEDNDNEADE